jgi:RNase P protein component
MLREFFRIHQGGLASDQDVLIIPRKGADTLEFAQVAEELGRALSLVRKTD